MARSVKINLNLINMRENEKDFRERQKGPNKIRSFKTIIIDGKKRYYPISELERFADRVAKKYNIHLLPETYINDVSKERHYKKSGIIPLAKDKLRIFYASVVESGLLKDSIHAVEKPARFNEIYGLIIENEEVKEAGKLNRLKEDNLYALTYFCTSPDEFMKKYDSLKETGGFIQIIRDMLPNKSCKEFSFQRIIDLKKEYENLLNLFDVMVKYEQSNTVKQEEL